MLAGTPSRGTLYEVHRYILEDDWIDFLNIGMLCKEEVDANIKTFSSDATHTPEDRAFLAQFCAKGFYSGSIKAMRVD